MGEIFIPFWHQKFHIRTLLQKISDVFFILFYRKCTGRIQEHSALFQHIRRIEQQLSLDRHIVIRSFLQPVFYHCLIPAEHPFSGTRCIDQDLVKIRRISFFELIGLFT